MEKRFAKSLDDLTRGHATFKMTRHEKCVARPRKIRDTDSQETFPSRLLSVFTRTLIFPLDFSPAQDQNLPGIHLSEEQFPPRGQETHTP